MLRYFYLLFYNSYLHLYLSSNNDILPLNKIDTFCLSHLYLIEKCYFDLCYVSCSSNAALFTNVTFGKAATCNKQSVLLVMFAISRFSLSSFKTSLILKLLIIVCEFCSLYLKLLLKRNLLLTVKDKYFYFQCV